MVTATAEPGLDLSPTQWEFVHDDRRFLVFIAGRNGGKTTAACMRLIKMIQDGTIIPGARIVVFGPSYPQLKKGTLQTFDKWFDAAGMIVEKVNGNEPERRLINGIVAYFRNASNPDQTRSHEVQVVWLDEAAQMDEGVLTLTNAACRQFGDRVKYQTLITTTPRGRNWLWRCFKNPETYRYPEDMFGFYSTTTIEAQEYGVVREGYLEELGYVEGSDMWKQEVEAQFLTWAGLVFNQFNPQKHAASALPKFKHVYGGVDIGQASPTALILVGQDERGGLWAFKEWYQRRANMHEWMRVCAEWTQGYGVKRWLVDSAADIEIRSMRAAGLQVKPSIKAKDAAGTAVNFINSKMARDEFFLTPDCPALKSEVESYQYKELMTGDEVTFLDKVKPNQSDHAIDAMRYAVLPLSSAQSRTNAGWGRIRFGG